MIGRDCRCPGCGTCGAASEVERLRERLAVERTPNGAGKWNAERVLREKAERERDEVAKERDLARLACNAYWHDLERIASLCERTADEYPLKAVERTVRERDELKAKLDAELPAMWREDIASLNECLDRVGRERDELKARLAHAEADAEQAIHNEAFMERQRIVAWIRARHALGSMDCSLSLMALDALRVVADEIERGEHGE